MVALYLALTFAPAQALPRFTYEPFYFGYLDEIAEIDIRPKYHELSKNKAYETLTNAEVKVIWRNNPRSAYAWKLLIDTFLKNNSGPELLRFVDDTSITPPNYNFDCCKRYAIRVVLAKCVYSSSYFDRMSLDQILKKYPKIDKGQSWNPNAYPTDLDVWLADYAEERGDTDSSRRIFQEFKDKYPNDYGVHLYAAKNLFGEVTVIQTHPKPLPPKIVRHSLPEQYIRGLKALREKWPNEEAPCYLLMRHYEKSDPKLAKVYAKKYLAMVKKTFRTSWIEAAKKVLAIQTSKLEL